MTDIVNIPTDKSLTLKPQRLAGSEYCLNCSTEMKGPFCYYCGQPDKRFLRFFPVMVREMLQDLFELDSRFTRTLSPLLFHPGRLTRDYIDGRRFRYTPPIRIYLFASVIFFVLASFASNFLDWSEAITVDDEFHAAATITSDDLEAIEELPAETREQVLQALEEQTKEDNDFRL